MLRSMTVIALDGRSLTPAEVVAIARRRAEAAIEPAARERNAAAERLVRELLERGDLLYGVTTGVGALRSAAVARSRTRATTSGGCCAATRAAAARR